MDLAPADIPSMNNIYSSDYFDKVRADEQNRSNKKYKDAQSPFETGIISTPAYASMFQTLDSPELEYKNKATVSSLTGNKLNIEQFSHNNMTPFIKGNVTQNVNVDNTTSRLDTMTGTDQYYKHKKETENFFKPIAGNGNVCGMKNYDDYYKDRIVKSKLQTSTFPIESVRVGPGLGKGFTSYGSGGFQQSDSLKYSMPKTIDQLRSKVNQNNKTFEIPTGPAKGVDQRGMVAPLAKNSTEKSFEQSPDQWLKTTGANMKDTERPEQYLKATSKVDSHIEYSGVANNGIISGKGSKDDYGKSSIVVYSNERQFTETKTVVANATSIVKAIIAPIVDALKLSIKEYTIDSSRANGNARTQIPEKSTLYDPVNHIMRTTIKETTVGDSEINNLTGPQQTYSALEDTAKTTVKETTVSDSEMNNLTGPNETYSALDDFAKTTVKETTIHDSEMNNLSGPNETYSALEDLAKTTIKETTIHDTTINNFKGHDGTYVNTDDKPKTTVKETLPVQDTIRNIGSGTYKVYVYDPDMVVKKTVKETTIKGKSEFGFLGGILEGLFGAYITTPVELKNTQKQFTSVYNEYGIASGSADEHRQTSREAEYNAQIDDTREKILIAAGHTPNAGSMGMIGSGREDVNMSTKKQFENSMASRNAGNISKIYQSSPLPIEECSLTKPHYTDNAYKDRLDSSLLNALKTNEFDIRINPIKSC